MCELLQFSDDSVWQAMRDLRPEDLMRLHDLMGSAFAHPFKLTPLRFTHPPPDVEMNDSGRGRGSNDVPTEAPIMWDGCAFVGACRARRPPTLGCSVVPFSL